MQFGVRKSFSNVNIPFHLLHNHVEKKSVEEGDGQISTPLLKRKWTRKQLSNRKVEFAEKFLRH